jgi:predicted NUDIX family NTP pyrophosphohydrolase
MPKRSAGLLVYRRVDGQPEVLLVHPGGPYWAKKDDGAWSLPKGEYVELRRKGERCALFAPRRFEIDLRGLNTLWLVRATEALGSVDEPP